MRIRYTYILEFDFVGTNYNIIHKCSPRASLRFSLYIRPVYLLCQFICSCCLYASFYFVEFRFHLLVGVIRIVWLAMWSSWSGRSSSSVCIECKFNSFPTVILLFHMLSSIWWVFSYIWHANGTKAKQMRCIRMDMKVHSKKWFWKVTIFLYVWILSKYFVWYKSWPLNLLWAFSPHLENFILIYIFIFSWQILRGTVYWRKIGENVFFSLCCVKKRQTFVKTSWESDENDFTSFSFHAKLCTEFNSDLVTVMTYTTVENCDSIGCHLVVCEWAWISSAPVPWSTEVKNLTSFNCILY